MARNLFWLRSVGSFQDNAATDTHDLRIGLLAPGETLTRMRFKYFLSSYNADNPVLTDDVVIAAGIIVHPNIDTPPNIYPATSATIGDWVWWEGETQGVQLFNRDPTLGVVTEARGPQDRSERDVKAQRRNSTTDAQGIWFKTQSTVPGSQGQHYLGYSFSVGILQAF